MIVAISQKKSNNLKMLPSKRILRSSKNGTENTVRIEKGKSYDPKNLKSKRSNAVNLQKFDATKVKIKKEADSKDFKGKGKKAVKLEKFDLSKVKIKKEDSEDINGENNSAAKFQKFDASKVKIKKEDPDSDLEDFDEFQVTTSGNKRSLSQQTNRQPCPECGKMLAKSSMKEHLKIHANNRYRCYKCGETFSSQLAVRDHNMRYHTLENKSVNSCKCDFCSKSFIGSSKLAEHVCKAHGKAEKQADKSKTKSTVSNPKRGRCKADRPFKCAICEKTFIKFDKLRDHITIHQHRCIRCGHEILARKAHYWHRCII